MVKKHVKRRKPKKARTKKHKRKTNSKKNRTKIWRNKRTRLMQLFKK